MTSTPTLNAHADATGAAALRNYAEQALDTSMPDPDDYVPDTIRLRDEDDVLKSIRALVSDLRREFRESVADLADRLERGTLL